MTDSRQIVKPAARIKVVGIGGAGTNAVNTMIQSQVEGVEFIAANSDIQSLSCALAPNKIQVGKELTKGLGAGADPDVGRDAALEDRHEMQEKLIGADMVFITAGMGGGTGTGGAPVAAQIAKEQGALTVAVVTTPFAFEGKRRKNHADSGISRLKEHTDTLLVIPNNKLLQLAMPEMSMSEAFKMTDSILVNAVRGISDIINIPGQINVDFADVKAVMSSMGHALMGIGTSSSPKRAAEAAFQAISSPLLEDTDIEGATGVLINIRGASSVSLIEVSEICSIIQEAAHEEANLIFGTVIDEDMGDEIQVTVIATGFPGDRQGHEFATSFQKTAFGKDFVPERPSILPRRAAPLGTLRKSEEVAPPPKVPAEDRQMAAEAPKDFLKPPAPYEPEKTATTPTSAPIEESPGLLSTLTSEEFRSESDARAHEDHSPSQASEQPASESSTAAGEPEPPSILANNDYASLESEIDRKIDEALDLAARVTDHSEATQADNLDIPTFLRAGASKSENESAQPS